MKEVTYNASVIISSFNQADTIKKTLDALEDQSRQKGYSVQVIIADDGSSLAQVSDLAAEMKKHGPSISTNLVWQQNTEFRLAASRNNGLALAESEIIIFVDGDCIPDPGFLEAHINAHNAHGGLALFTGHRIFDVPANIDRVLHRDILDRLKIKEGEESYDIEKRAQSAHPWGSIIGRNFSFRHKFKNHKFDENIVGWGIEDISFSAEYYRLGCRSYSYLLEASVTQIDDFSLSRNPYESKSQKSIAYAITNGALTMKKFEAQDYIYKQMALFLAHYTIPFPYKDGQYSYNAEQANQFFRKAASGLSYTNVEAKTIYNDAIIDLADFFARNPDIKTHPYISGITSPSTEGMEVKFSLIFNGESAPPLQNKGAEFFIVSDTAQSAEALKALARAEEEASQGQVSPETKIVILDQRYDQDDASRFLERLAKGKVVPASSKIALQECNNQSRFQI